MRASANVPSAFPSRAHSSFERKPLRNFCASTLASEQSMRIAKASADISRQKMPTTALLSIAACCASVKRETRFTHRRSRGDHHEILLLQSGSQRVKSAKAGGDAGHNQIAMLHGFGLFQHALRRMFDVLKALANPFVSQREDRVLGMIENVLRLVFFFQRLAGDFVGDLDELSQKRLSANDLRVCAMLVTCGKP